MANAQEQAVQEIRALERQLLDLRRRLDGHREPLPVTMFHALELRVGDAWYAVPVPAIHEVLGMLWPRPLPEAPEWVLGTFLYGSQVVPLIDLGRRLHDDPTPLTPSAVIVLVDRGGDRLAGLAADSVRDLLSVDPADVVPPSPDFPQAPFLVGSLRDDDRFAHLLSTERLSRDVVLEDVLDHVLDAAS